MSNKSLNEVLENFNYIYEKSEDYKAIFTEQGKKVEGTRSEKLLLGKSDGEAVTLLNAKQWLALKLLDKTSEAIGKEFIGILVNQLVYKNSSGGTFGGNLGISVDYNTDVKSGKLKTFDDKLKWVISRGAKYTKRGLKRK